MKNQFSVVCSVALLVIAAGCSQPATEHIDDPIVSNPAKKTDTKVVPVGEPVRITLGDAGNPSGQGDVVDTLANMQSEHEVVEHHSSQGNAVSQNQVMLEKAAEAYRMMPSIASPPAYDTAGMYPGYYQVAPANRENYTHFDDNPVKRVAEQPVSTFSIDVDTGSYALVRRMLHNGQLPVQDAVRSEELINYFPYEYPVQAERSALFALYREIAPAPWNPDTYLLHIGIKGFEQDRTDMPAANLVFLVDVSGSMQDANKLELVKSSLKMLTRQLRKQDTVALVVYAGASGVVLEPTTGDNKAKILTALDQLEAGGSTNGADGIQLAYLLAEQAYIKGGINRVLLATDGDFNVGTVDIEQLKDLVAEKRESGIALSTLGFGEGNYNDALMEQMADIGNGNYAYIDTLNEARKALIEQMGSTMLTIARDVKIQIEFNPAVVAEYRLIGYENRALAREDFNNDKVDAGDIGAGHTVTAIYEIALTGSAGTKIDPLRYQAESPAAVNTSELALLRVRYKQPESDTSRLLEWNIRKDEILADSSRTSTEFRHAAAVAAFGQRLRGGEHLGDFAWADILTLAQSSRGVDSFGYRGEFISLIQLAESLGPTAQQENGRVGLVE